jgi:hypothetical protein
LPEQLRKKASAIKEASRFWLNITVRALNRNGISVWQISGLVRANPIVVLGAIGGGLFSMSDRASIELGEAEKAAIAARCG